MTAGTQASGVPAVMHVRRPDRPAEELYRQVLEQLAELSPVVQALPPAAALVDLRGWVQCFYLSQPVDDVVSAGSVGLSGSAAAG
jgi:hypothetical protein